MSGKPATERLDGPALVDWLEERRPNHYPTETETGTVADFLEKKDRRKLRHWRGGVNPSIFTADLVLTRLNIHPSELPDDLFVCREEGALA